MNKIFNLFKSTIDRFDIHIFIFIFLSSFGLWTMSSFVGENRFAEKQMIWVLSSILIIFLFNKIDYTFLKNSKLIMVFYFSSLLLLLATLLFGAEINGAKAWLNLGVFTLQPSDLMKLSLIILLAKYLSKRHVDIKNPRHIIVSFVYTIIPTLIIMAQPDLGSAVVLLFIWGAIMLVSGISRKHLFILISLGVLVMSLSWIFVFKDYQKNRILNFINPTRDIKNSGYNVYQSQIAVGSGGFLGKGVGYGTQSRLSYLPEHETDFIFAAFVEEWGFVGGLFMIVLFVILFVRLIWIAYYAKDNFQVFVIFGYMAWIFCHFMVNIGMNIGLLPVTGIPLPFVSYGGSHILIEVIGLTIITAFYKTNRKDPKRYYKNEFVGIE